MCNTLAAVGAITALLPWTLALAATESAPSPAPPLFCAHGLCAVVAPMLLHGRPVQPKITSRFTFDVDEGHYSFVYQDVGSIVVDVVSDPGCGARGKGVLHVATAYAATGEACGHTRGEPVRDAQQLWERADNLEQVRHYRVFLTFRSADEGNLIALTEAIGPLWIVNPRTDYGRMPRRETFPGPEITFAPLPW